MRQLLPLFLVFHFSVTSFAQYTDPPVNMSATDYLKKSNKQKTAGWILLGGGAGLAGIGIIVGSASLWDDVVNGDSGGLDAAAILMTAGLAGMAGSIPLFIAAGKNRRKAAASVSFKMEKTPITGQWVSSTNRYPALAIRVRL